MQRKQFEQFLASVFGAQDHEILCSEFFARLPRFVDLQAGGEDAAAAFPDVHHHLGQCPECHEVYLALLQAIQDESTETP